MVFEPSGTRPKSSPCTSLAEGVVGLGSGPTSGPTSSRAGPNGCRATIGPTNRAYWVPIIFKNPPRPLPLFPHATALRASSASCIHLPPASGPRSASSSSLTPLAVAASPHSSSPCHCIPTGCPLHCWPHPLCLLQALPLAPNPACRYHSAALCLLL